MNERVLNHPTLRHLSSNVLDLVDAPQLLVVIVTCGRLDGKYSTWDEAEKLINEDDNLRGALENAWEAKDFRSILNLEILQRVQPLHRTNQSTADSTVSHADQMFASALSWRNTYILGGEADFLKTINQRSKDQDAQKRYANHVAVIQSSGTGKSRMLHEVTSEVFGIILNLAPDTSNGFPRPDVAVRDYLIGESRPAEAQDRATRFFMALFIWLQELNPENPSNLQQTLGYGDEDKYRDRQSLLTTMIEKAKNMNLTKSSPKIGSPPLSKSQTSECQKPKSLDEIAEELSTKVLRKAVTRSLVKLVIAFDEASELTRSAERTVIYPEVRRALRAVRFRPIYGVFMSTAASVRQFHSPAKEDSSDRISTGVLSLWPPYTHIGYDQLAQPLKIGCTLDDVTNVEFMLGLGRPLWKTRYIHGNTAVRRTIVDFAKKKLLNSTDDDDNDEPRRIAPLAIRLPLKFNALTQKGREAEHRQIESHMRICLNIDSEAEVMYSVAPSEPILNEAAAQIMDSREKDSPGHTVKTLQKFLSDRYLSKGDRGELACMLLLLLARDQTCKAQEAQLAAPDPKLMPYNQPIRVTGFLTNLFSEYHKETILNSQSEIAGATLEDTFCDSWMHFTHFIKVHDFKVVNRNFLLRAMARGAAILCADNQLGVDVILPHTIKGRTLEPDNVGGVLLQLKNVALLTKLRKSIVTKMDARKIGVFEKGQEPPPIINIILSVGTQKASLPCKNLRQKRTSPRKHTTKPKTQLVRFEIFAAGLSPKTFRPIIPGDESRWLELVSRSGVEDVFGTKEDNDTIQRMTPCARADEGHWAAFFPLGDAKVSDDDVYGYMSSESDSE